MPSLDGIDRVMKHADEQWVQAALWVVRAVAERQEYFTVDDVQRTWQENPDRFRFERTHDYRAWGGVMKLAARKGMVESTGNWVGAASDGRPVRQWHSLRYVLERRP